MAGIIRSESPSRNWQKITEPDSFVLPVLLSLPGSGTSSAFRTHAPLLARPRLQTDAKVVLFETRTPQDTQETRATESTVLPGKHALPSGRSHDSAWHFTCFQ